MRALRWALAGLAAAGCLGALAGAAEPASACTVSPGSSLPKPDLVADLDESELVVQGTVVETDRASPQRAIIAVDRYFKGSGGPRVAITGFGPLTACRATVTTGQRGIFFAAAGPSGTWVAARRVGAAGIYPDAPDIAAAIVERTGTQPLAPAQPLAPTAGSAGTGQPDQASGGVSSNLWLLIGLPSAIALAFVAVTVAAVVRRPRRGR